MMKQGKFIALAALVISLVLLSLAGACIATGVSEADYNALKTELQTAKAELENLKAQGAGNAKVATYAEINDRCIDVWRVLSGEPSKYGYAKGEVGKWASDMTTRVTSVEDADLATLWKAFQSATPGADMNKKGIQLMGYVSDKLKTLTSK
jgi:hypothetical protein